VNDPDHYPLLQDYIQDRITTYLKYLETQKDFTKIQEMQGAIAELRRFETLRDQALEGAK
jgi:hypothetical protein